MKEEFQAKEYQQSSELQKLRLWGFRLIVIWPNVLSSILQASSTSLPAWLLLECTAYH